jgi:hypothetical protein
MAGFDASDFVKENKETKLDYIRKNIQETLTV